MASKLFKDKLFLEGNDKMSVFWPFSVKYDMSIIQRGDLNNNDVMTDIYHNLVIW